MRFSTAILFGSALLALSCAAPVEALNAPRILHRPRTPHILQTHRQAHHTRAVASPAAHARAAAPAAHAKAAASAGKRVVHTRGARLGSGAATVRRLSIRSHHHYYERFTASSFASSNQYLSDVTIGEDPVVRQAAIDALGDMNGTAVVINPANGRILAMVNQKLALSPGAEPCSTIKITVAMAALSEGLITKDTMVRLPGFRMNLTQALAHSNNLYFEELGRELGFERVRHYAHQFGLGELAGWHLDGEQLGAYPDHAIPASEGGVGRMCSFGQGVSMTPLQLGAYVAALANGGTLYYLQHPTTPAEIAGFVPRAKRKLEIAKYVPDLQDGMAGAVEYGTARRLRANFTELPVFGKTGTCSDKGTRFGWFASYSQSPMGGLVTVFFLEGGRPTFGPRAAELTGAFYRNLWDHNYFVGKSIQTNADALPAAQPAALQPAANEAAAVSDGGNF